MIRIKTQRSLAGCSGKHIILLSVFHAVD